MNLKSRFNCRQESASNQKHALQFEFKVQIFTASRCTSWQTYRSCEWHAKLTSWSWSAVSFSPTSRKLHVVWVKTTALSALKRKKVLMGNKYLWFSMERFPCSREFNSINKSARYPNAMVASLFSAAAIFPFISRSNKYFHEFHRSTRQKHDACYSPRKWDGGNAGEIKKWKSYRAAPRRSSTWSSLAFSTHFLDIFCASETT